MDYHVDGPLQQDVPRTALVALIEYWRRRPQRANGGKFEKAKTLIGTELGHSEKCISNLNIYALRSSLSVPMKKRRMMMMTRTICWMEDDEEEQEQNWMMVVNRNKSSLIKVPHSIHPHDDDTRRYPSSREII